MGPTRTGEIRNDIVACSRILISLLLALGPSPALAQREKISLPREHRGKQVTITGELYLPHGTAKVPAMVVHHGSGGATAKREGTNAREIVKLGVGAFVPDSFKGRGVNEMLDDAFASPPAGPAQPASAASAPPAA